MSAVIPPRNRPGRPLRHPERGPASVAERAATRRSLNDREVRALAECLRKAMLQLEQAGHPAAWLFWQEGLLALDAVRRRAPEVADDLLALQKTGRDLNDELVRRRHGPAPAPGRSKGSIIVGGHEFSIDSTGRVLRGEEPTRLRVNAEYNCWVVVDVDSPSFRPRRHYVAMGGKAMALLDAALIVTAADAALGTAAP